MNILHITTFLQGGAGRIIADLACSQSLSGHKVMVVASGTGEQDYGNYQEWLDRLTSNGVRLVLVNSTFKRDLALNIAAFRKIGESLDCASLSLIHTHAAIPSLLALLIRARQKRAMPIMQTMHGWGIQKNAEQTATDITLMNQLDRIVTTSESSKRLLLRFGLAPELIEVVPNGVGPSPPAVEGEFPRMLADWRSEGLTVLVCLGTVGPRKNQRLLLQAMAQPLAPRNLACAFFGEGKEIPALETLVQESGIGRRVRFVGYQPEGAQFIAGADWLILPSNDEGLPLSILEAYRACVPVIGSNIPEIAEVILPEKTGILFQAGNLGSLAEALERAAKMPESERARMGRASRALWLERYSLEAMLSHYGRIYGELMLTESPVC
jgi:glycosyltransferase involved in cell wall biosynthesis